MTAVQICSISPEEIRLPMRTYKPSGYVIPACPKDKPFTSTVITDMVDEKKIYTEYEWTKAERIPIPIPVDQIISDYFRSEKLKEQGCFVIPADAIPSQAQIDEAHHNRITFLQLLVSKGDDEFLRTKRIDQIPDFCKRAVKELGATREWAYQAPARMVECPACGDTIKEGVAVCKSCGAIIDREKAREFGLLDEKEEVMAEKPRRGRPPRKKESVPEEKDILGGI